MRHRRGLRIKSDRKKSERHDRGRCVSRARSAAPGGGVHVRGARRHRGLEPRRGELKNRVPIEGARQVRTRQAISLCRGVLAPALWLIAGLLVAAPEAAAQPAPASSSPTSSGGSSRRTTRSRAVGFLTAGSRFVSGATWRSGSTSPASTLYTTGGLRPISRTRFSSTCHAQPRGAPVDSGAKNWTSISARSGWCRSLTGW